MFQILVPIGLGLIGGYLSCDYKKKPQKYSHGGIVNFLSQIDFKTDIDNKEEINKIELVNSVFDFYKVVGKVTPYETFLKFYDKNDFFLFSIEGKYDDTKDELTSILRRNGKSFSFNYHPFAGIGGVDYEKLKLSLLEAYEKTDLFDYSDIKIYFYSGSGESYIKRVVNNKTKISFVPYGELREELEDRFYHIINEHDNDTSVGTGWVHVKNNKIVDTYYEKSY